MNGRFFSRIDSGVRPHRQALKCWTAGPDSQRLLFGGLAVIGLPRDSLEMIGGVR